jgi:hypothetical protein
MQNIADVLMLILAQSLALAADTGAFRLTPGTTRIVPVIAGADTTILQLPSGIATGVTASDSTLPWIFPLIPASM